MRIEGQRVKVSKHSAKRIEHRDCEIAKRAGLQGKNTEYRELMEK